MECVQHIGMAQARQWTREPEACQGERERILDSTAIDIDDQHDIQASLGGETDVYARLVERYESRIFAQMWRFTRDQRVLEELVQDVFVEAYLCLDKFRGEAPFLHWLRRIATRVGYRYWKLESRERERQSLLAQRAATEINIRDPKKPSEAGEELFHILESLTPNDRLVLTLSYFEDCSTKEIADRTGWNATLVRVRLHRACKRLRRLMIEAGYGRQCHE